MARGDEPEGLTAVETAAITVTVPGSAKEGAVEKVGASTGPLSERPRDDLNKLGICLGKLRKDTLPSLRCHR
jgi:hypothetical protein